MRRYTSLLAIAGVLCILCSSLGMLAASWYNRAGTPASTLELTERELGLPASDSEAADSSALSFRLIWRVEGMSHSDLVPQQPSTIPVPWMTAAKSAQLGVASAGDLRRRSEVSAFLVLEFNGPAYARELRRACRSGEAPDCNAVRDSESRLYVIDAGLDAARLRQLYPEPALYAIVRGTVTFAARGSSGPPSAYIGGIDIETIQAIEPLRSAKRRSSAEMTWRRLADGQPFVSVIRFGHRHEPWDVSVSFGPHASPPPVEMPAAQDQGGNPVTVN